MEKIGLVYQVYKDQDQGYSLSTQTGHYSSDLHKIFAEMKSL